MTITIFQATAHLRNTSISKLYLVISFFIRSTCQPVCLSIHPSMFSVYSTQRSSIHDSHTLSLETFIPAQQNFLLAIRNSATDIYAIRDTDTIFKPSHRHHCCGRTKINDKNRKHSTSPAFSCWLVEKIAIRLKKVVEHGYHHAQS